MGNRYVSAAVASALALLSVVSVAEQDVKKAPESNAAAQAAAKALQERYPRTRITSVRETPMQGIYEVVMGRNVAYTDKEGRYFMFGHLFDMKTQTDLTEPAVEAANQVSWDRLPKDRAVVMRQGEGRREIAVFSDPDCPYCRKLEAELAKLQDVTIYVYMIGMPMHPKAKEKNASVWCAADRAEAWRKIMLEGKELAAATCPNPLAEVEKLARDIGVTGTPTMVSQDGRRLIGARSVDHINLWLGATAVKGAKL